MRQVIGSAVACALALGVVGCAYGVVDEPGGDGDLTVELADFELPGGGEDDGKATIPIGGGTADGACYANQGACNPMQPSCGTGEACDLTADEGFACFPPPNEAIVGFPCDASVGPFCMNGSTCIEGTCRAYCCSTSDCGVESCQPVDLGVLSEVKVCLP